MYATKNLHYTATNIDDTAHRNVFELCLKENSNKARGTDNKLIFTFKYGKKQQPASNRRLLFLYP